jgi:hypothetical protein
MAGRFIQETGTNHPGGTRMNIAVSMEQVRTITGSMERREQVRNGGSREEARKRLDATVRDRLSAFAVRDLQSELERLSNELVLVRQMGVHPACDHVLEIETHMARVRALLTEAGR